MKNLIETKYQSNTIFRPIHYLGSKYRILDFIEKIINEVDPSGGRVCDLFAGSGTVSYKLSTSRPVIAVDIQEYSRVICSAILNPIKTISIENFTANISNSEHYKTLIWALEPLIEYENYCMIKALSGECEPLCDLIDNGSIITYELSQIKNGNKKLVNAIKLSLKRLGEKNLLEGSELLLTRYFGGLYYSFHQAVIFDSILQYISNCDKNRDTLLAALLSTASDAVNTVGKQFAQPIRPRKSTGEIKLRLGKEVYKDRSIDIFSLYEKWLLKYNDIHSSPFTHQVLKMDYTKALDLLPKDTKIVYADPPYTRDHYSRFYHTLETICLRDNPKVSTNVLNGKTQISRGVYREGRHQSPFCIKSLAPSAFENMFKKVRCIDASLILSYSPYDEIKKAHPRLLTMDQLLKIAKKHYKSIEVLYPREFNHSKLNHSSKHLEASNNAEVIIICTSI